MRVCVFLCVRMRVNMLDLKVDMDTRKFIFVRRFEPMECSISKRTVFKLCYRNVCRILIWGDVGLRGSKGLMGSNGRELGVEKWVWASNLGWE